MLFKMLNRALRAAALAVAIVCSTAALGPEASAQSTRTFVSGKGVDSGACGVASPCRTFAYAYQQTIAGGDMYVLDSAGYGPLSIDRSITVINESYIAGAKVSAGAAIDINTSPNDRVILKGLTLDGSATANYGIRIYNVGDITILNCVIKNVIGTAIYFGSGNANRTFTIADTFATNAGNGVLVDGTGSGIVRSSVFQNGVGGSVGVYMASSGTITLDNVTAIGNGYGFYGYRGTSLISRSTFTGNRANGVLLQSGSHYTYKDNRINGNGADIVGSLIDAPLR